MKGKEKYLVRLVSMSEAERKRIEYAIERIGKQKLKGIYSIVDSLDDVRKLLGVMYEGESGIYKINRIQVKPQMSNYSQKIPLNIEKSKEFVGKVLHISPEKIDVGTKYFKRWGNLKYETRFLPIGENETKIELTLQSHKIDPIKKMMKLLDNEISRIVEYSELIKSGGGV